VKKLASFFGSCLARSGAAFSVSSLTRRVEPFFVPFLVLVTAAVATSLLVEDASARIRRVPSEYKTIQKAIDLAGVGDTILVGPGIYKESLLLRTSASLISTRGAARTIIDAGGRGSALKCDQVDSTVTIRGFTFKNGVSDNGGGLFLSSSFPRVTDNIFTADSATYGGGLCALWSNSLIKNNKFIGNKAKYGGAMYTMFIAPTIDSNLVENNKAELAGGFYFARSSEARVKGNIVRGNQAKDGGGVFSNRALPTLEGNVFQGNKAEQGGAISSWHALGIIKDNIISGNVGSRGAAIALTDTVAPDIRGNTIVNNSAPDSLCAGIYFSSTYMNVTNNIIAHNSPGYAIYCLAGATPVLSCNILWDNQTGNYSGVISQTADLYEDPLFCARDRNDFSVREGSPALNEKCGNIGAKGKGCRAAKVTK
jgi:hypothetical protein